MASKLTSFLGNTIRVKGVGFQENPLKRSRDTAVNILCSTNTVPIITDWSQKKEKKALLVSSVHTVLGVECQENSWNTELDTALRVSRSPALHYWPIATKMTSFVSNARRVLVVEYYENPTTVRLQYSIRKLLFLIDHLHSNWSHLQAMHVESELWTLGKTPRIEAEVLPCSYLFSK